MNRFDSLLEDVKELIKQEDKIKKMISSMNEKSRVFIELIMEYKEVTKNSPKFKTETSFVNGKIITKVID